MLCTSLRMISIAGILQWISTEYLKRVKGREDVNFVKLLVMRRVFSLAIVYMWIVEMIDAVRISQSRVVSVYIEIK